MSARAHMLHTLDLGFETIEDDCEALCVSIDVVALILAAVPPHQRKDIGDRLIDAAIVQLGTASKATLSTAGEHQ